MKIEVKMLPDEQTLEINQWWARDPAFAIAAFKAQIEAARILWPVEFAGLELAYLDADGRRID